MDLYLENALQCSKETTNKYSTSFSLGVSLLDKSIRPAIYAIYGYVRFADEIVDTFYNQNQKQLLDKFKKETFDAIDNKLCINPIIHSFQWAVNKFGIEHHLIESFLTSMEMDLSKTVYNPDDYKKYIYGSAEVVGLMCLRVFCYHDPHLYSDLINSARKLGEAFQKVNFLRDIEADFDQRGRTYFPDINFSTFNQLDKQQIEKDIERDFSIALAGIAQLPLNSRFGVYLAYSYYLWLLKKIKQTSATIILKRRIRISNTQKIWILVKTYTAFSIRKGAISNKQLMHHKEMLKNQSQQAYA